MGKNLLALGLMVVCVSVAAAEPGTSWAEKMFGPAESLVHDFGNVPRGAMLYHDFVMTNNFTVPIQITSLRMSGCSTVTASKHKLEPNEKAVITVCMDTSRFVGQKSVTAYLAVDGSGTDEVRLIVTANVRQEVVCNPAEVGFATVTTGQAPTETVDIEYAGSLDWQISEVIVPKQAPFEATVTELYRRAERVGYRVTIALRKDANTGQFRERILLKTNDPDARLLTVYVTGNVESRGKANQ